MANAAVDFLLSEMIANSASASTYRISEIERVETFGKELSSILDDFKQTSEGLIVNRNQIFLMNEDKERQLIEYFRKTVKTAISEIIKNNNWKL